MFRKVEMPGGKENIKIIIWAVIIAVGSAFVYYRSLLGLIPGVFAGIYAFHFARKRELEKHRQKMLTDFKNLIIAMESALEAGKSMENALIAATNDLKRMNSDSKDMINALEMVHKKLSLNVTLEEALKDFAKLMDLEEIYDFVMVISTIKRTGGNAIKVIRDTVQKIVEEIELREELDVMVAAKKLEQQVMVYMPATIILFLRTSNGDFLNPLYGNLLGILIMTVALITNVAADYLGKKIVAIN